MNKSSMGFDENIAIFFCYLLGWVSGLIIYLLEKENSLVKFHAAQSIVLFGAISIIQTIFGFGLIFSFGLTGLLSLATFIIWIILLVKSLSKDYLRIPVVEDIAEKFVKNVNI